MLFKRGGEAIGEGERELKSICGAEEGGNEDNTSSSSTVATLS